MGLILDIMTENAEFRRRLARLENETRVLTRIRKITNELLSNCAYSEKNRETQEGNLNKVFAPEWEKQILKKAWRYKHNKAEQLFKELEQLLEDNTKKDKTT